MSEPQTVINLEEAIGKTVGRRRPPQDALASGFALQATLNQFLQTTGHRLCKRGRVYRFRTHEEADAWTLSMMSPKKTD